MKKTGLKLIISLGILILGLFFTSGDSHAAIDSTTDIQVGVSINHTMSIFNDSSDFSTIIYLDDAGGPTKLSLIQCTNADCTTKNGPTTLLSGLFYGISAYQGADGFAKIVFAYDDGAHKIGLINCTNADCTTRDGPFLVTTVPTLLQNDSLEARIDAAGNANIVYTYLDSGTSKLDYIRCSVADCSTKTTQTIESSTTRIFSYPSLWIYADDDLARIAVQNQLTSDNSGEFKTYRCDNADCSSVIVTPSYLYGVMESYPAGSSVGPTGVVMELDDGFPYHAWVGNGILTRRNISNGTQINVMANNVTSFRMDIRLSGFTKGNLAFTLGGVAGAKRPSYVSCTNNYSSCDTDPVTGRGKKHRLDSADSEFITHSLKNNDPRVAYFIPNAGTIRYVRCSTDCEASSNVTYRFFNDKDEDGVVDNDEIFGAGGNPDFGTIARAGHIRYFEPHSGCPDIYTAPHLPQSQNLRVNAFDALEIDSKLGSTGSSFDPVYDMDEDGDIDSTDKGYADSGNASDCPIVANIFEFSASVAADGTADTFALSNYLMISSAVDFEQSAIDTGWKITSWNTPQIYQPNCTIKNQPFTSSDVNVCPFVQDNSTGGVSRWVSKSTSMSAPNKSFTIWLGVVQGPPPPPSKEWQFGSTSTVVIAPGGQKSFFIDTNFVGPWVGDETVTLSVDGCRNANLDDCLGDELFINPDPFFNPDGVINVPMGAVTESRILDISAQPDHITGLFYIDIKGVLADPSGTGGPSTSTMSVKVIVRADPWVKTTGGDVGTFNDVVFKRDVDTFGETNAEFLAIAQNFVDNFFTSERNWLVDNYSISNELTPTFYDYFWNNFGGIKATTWDASNDGIIPVERGVYAYPSIDQTTSEDFTYNGSSISDSNPVVIFINGKLNINTDLDLGAKKVVFIVKNNINISPVVRNIDGFFITSQNFSTGSFFLTPGPGGAPVEMQMNSLGYPQMVYYLSSTQRVKFLSCLSQDCAGTTKTTINASGEITGKGVAIAIGSDDLARIVYYSATDQLYKFVRCLNTSCTSKSVNNLPTTIDNIPDASEAALDLDSTNKASIIYNNLDGSRANSQLLYLRCNDTVCSSFSTPVDLGATGKDMDIAIGLDGNARIYNQIPRPEYTICGNLDCSSFSRSVVDNASVEEGELELGSDGCARIVTSKLFPYQVSFYLYSGAGCSTKTTTILDANSIGQSFVNLSLALGPDDNVRLAYTPRIIVDTRFLICGDLSCETTVDVTNVVPNPPTVGANAVDVIPSGPNSGISKIVYFDVDNADLDMADCLNVNCTSKNLITLDGAVGDLGDIDFPLTIEGGVVAGQILLNRDLGLENASTPAELINYDPSYLYIFAQKVGGKSLLGGEKRIFKELNP